MAGAEIVPAATFVFPMRGSAWLGVPASTPQHQGLPALLGSLFNRQCTADVVSHQQSNREKTIEWLTIKYGSSQAPAGLLRFSGDEW
jgi:hypothetical protein